MGVPCVINREGGKEVIQIPLNDMDQNKFDKSYSILKAIKLDIKKEISK